MASTVLREGGMSLLLLREGGSYVYECEAPPSFALKTGPSRVIDSIHTRVLRSDNPERKLSLWQMWKLRGGNQMKAKKKAI